jgi:hypothetical protein
MPSPGHVVKELLTRQGKVLPHSERCPTCRERPAYTPVEMADRHQVSIAQRQTPRPPSSAERPGRRKMPGSDEPKVWFEEEVSDGQ